METIEGLRLIKEAFPHVETMLGISNVYFGLPAGGARGGQLGLPLSLHGPAWTWPSSTAEKLERYASIPDEMRRVAEDLLFNMAEDAAPATGASNDLEQRRPSTSANIAS